MSENTITTRYMNAYAEDRIQRFGFSSEIYIDEDICLTNERTIRIELDSYYYVIEHNQFRKSYDIIHTNNPALYKRQ
jgi:hypothetical protein